LNYSNPFKNPSYYKMHLTGCKNWKYNTSEFLLEPTTCCTDKNSDGHM